MSFSTYGTLRPVKLYVKSDIRGIWRKMTTLGFAILGLLARESLSGYDLTQRMKGRVGFFWGAGHSQIYPELARLEEGGFVTHSVVEQRERPNKKVFEITQRGLEALKGWATEPPPRKPPKDELTLKAYSVWLADGAEAAGVFSDEGRRHEEQLARGAGVRGWAGGGGGEEGRRALVGGGTSPRGAARPVRGDKGLDGAGVDRRPPQARVAALRLLRGAAPRHPLREGQRRAVPLAGGGRGRGAGGGGGGRGGPGG